MSIGIDEEKESKESMVSASHYDDDYRHFMYKSMKYWNATNFNNN